MSETRQATGSEGAAAPATSMSEAEVMAGIEGLLEPPRRQRAQQTPPREPQEAPAAPETGDDPAVGPEDPAPGDTEEADLPDEPDGEADTEPAAVEPPRSWSNADKEVFAQLPPEAQAVIARRESERDKAFNAKTQEIAQHRQALEATFGEIQQERQSYAKNLEQLLFVAAPEAQKFAQIDWQRLASEQPAEYVRLTAERDALRGRIGGIQQELQRVSEQSQQAQAQQFAQLRQAEMGRLVEKLPDFGDETKGPKLAGDMRAWLQQRGFSDTEIGQVIDHRVLLVVNEAMRASQQAQARQQAEAKRTAGAAPNVQPPGAGRQRSDTRAAQVRAQKMGQLRKSGSERDAISYLMEIL
jgi:hypothetical protein